LLTGKYSMRSQYVQIAILLAASHQLPAQSERTPEFDAASVKAHPAKGAGGTMMRETPGSLNYIGVPLMSVIARAYGVEGLQIVGPSWVYADPYDIKTAYPLGTPPAQMQLMLRGLLADRFHLTVHHETRQIPAFALSIEKRGIKMRVAESGPPSYRPTRDAVGTHVRGSITMPNLAAYLTYQAGAPVVDRTGLDGLYEIKLDFAPAQNPPTDGSESPSLFTALQEQLGLRLDSQKAPFDMIVIDHAEKFPTEN